MDKGLKKEIDFFVNKRLTQNVGKKLLKFYIENYTHEGYYVAGEFTNWAERKDKKNTNPLLYKSGNMKKSFRLDYPTDGEFEITNTAEYAKYIQEGTSKMVARPIIYDDKKVTDFIEEETLNEINNFITNLLKK